jgi:hypothetical protein
MRQEQGRIFEGHHHHTVTSMELCCGWMVLRRTDLRIGCGVGGFVWSSGSTGECEIKLEMRDQALNVRQWWSCGSAGAGAGDSFAPCDTVRMMWTMWWTMAMRERRSPTGGDPPSVFIQSMTLSIVVMPPADVTYQS